MGSDITLTSTTDSLEQVQDALQIPAENRATKVEEPATTPPPAPAAPAATEPPAPAAGAPPPAATEPPAPAAAAPATDDDDLDDATPTAEQTPQQRQRRNRVQQRISELVRERDTARGLSAAKEAELVALRKRVEELAGGKPAAGTEAAPGTETPATEPKPKPTPDKYPSYEEYTEAMAEWKAEQIADARVTAAVKAERDRAEQARAQAGMQEAGQRYMEQVSGARTKYEDYDAVVGREDLQISATMQHGMLTSAVGAEIAYYLGQHPEECQALFAHGDNPTALRAFGRLESRVEALVEAQKKAAEAAAAPVGTPAAGEAAKPAAAAAPGATTLAAAGGVTPPRDAQTGRFVSPAQATTRLATKAPDPISPVGGGQATETTVDPSQMSYQEYKAYRNAQEAANRRR